MFISISRNVTPHPHLDNVTAPQRIIEERTQQNGNWRNWSHHVLAVITSNSIFHFTSLHILGLTISPPPSSLHLNLPICLSTLPSSPLLSFPLQPVTYSPVWHVWWHKTYGRKGNIFRFEWWHQLHGFLKNYNVVKCVIISTQRVGGDKFWKDALGTGRLTSN